MEKKWFEKKITFKEFIDPYSAMDAYQRSFSIIVEGEEIEELEIVWTHRWWSEIYNPEDETKTDFLAFYDTRLPYGITLNQGNVPFKKVIEILEANYNSPKIITLEKYKGFDYSKNPHNK